MTVDISRYSTILFDCDGVVLNSNKVKSDAFYKSVAHYGNAIAAEFVEYHEMHGGVSRYEKFRHFIEKYSTAERPAVELEKLLASYATHVQAGLERCEVAKGLFELRQQAPDVPWIIVSGGDQQELREIFQYRNLSRFFDGGIFGSPSTKAEIVNAGLRDGLIHEPTLFLGDSVHDYEVANEFDFDFIFVAGWTDVKDWREFVSLKRIASVEALDDLNRIWIQINDR